MAQHAKITGDGRPLDETMHAADCGCAAELMDALAVCAADQLRELREVMQTEGGRAETFAGFETFDIVAVLMEAVRTQARIVQTASDAIQHLQMAAYQRANGNEVEA